MAPCLLRLKRLLGLPSSSTSLGLEEYWLLCNSCQSGFVERSLLVKIMWCALVRTVDGSRAPTHCVASVLRGHSGCSGLRAGSLLALPHRSLSYGACRFLWVEESLLFPLQSDTLRQGALRPTNAVAHHPPLGPASATVLACSSWHGGISQVRACFLHSI